MGAKEVAFCPVEGSRYPPRGIVYVLIEMLRANVLALLGLRYRIRTEGLDQIASKGTRGILFLPTHPAYIDPVIVTTVLTRQFRARPFADADAVDNPVIHSLLKLVRAFQIPTVARYGKAAEGKIEAVLQQSIEALRCGDNVIVYPGGHIMRTGHETVSGTSAVETILHALPDVRVVLVKTRGLWGSRFSLYRDLNPNLKSIMRQSSRDLLANFLFFTPRRPVELRFEEPADFPRKSDRHAINDYIETSFNRDAPPASYVPYTIWESEGAHDLPEPERAAAAGKIENVSAATRDIVTKHLVDLCGKSQIGDDDQLAHDLGLDSLKRAELLLWVESEFGFPQGNSDSLQTAGDVMMAASGEALAASETQIAPAGPRWFAGDNDDRIAVAPGDTIAAAFLSAAARAPSRAVVADEKGGMKSYRDLVMGVLALLPAVQKLPGEQLGIMLPASVGASLAYLTVMFAGRTPVMINWTVGKRNLQYALELSGTQRVLTARALVMKIKAQGLDISGIEDRLVYLEDLGAQLSKTDKLKAFVNSWFNWGALRQARISPTAAILFTSGSETVPKGVPLSHVNVLTDLRDTLSMVNITGRDRLLAMLPPFHSFGLTIDLTVPLTTGMRTVFHANPTEGALLASLMEAYKGTVIVATPTFLQGILRAGSNEQLANVRLAVVGAEACPTRVYELLSERSPKAVLIEGYGITECSPIVALNVPENPKPGTIGKMIPSLQHLLVDVESGKPSPEGSAGMLLLRGPTIFDRYLGDAPDPFVEAEGQRWYRTGDLVRSGADGVFTFTGRLKRFIKLGGEMISLPAIESALLDKYGSAKDDGPTLAVVATPGDHPELVLFATGDLDREKANSVLRDAGLSSLYNLRRVERIDAIPVLGTGKTDYRSLEQRLSKQQE